MRHSYERWLISLDVRIGDGIAPSHVQVRHALKRLWRSYGLRCRGFSVDEELLELRAEVKRLRAQLVQRSER